MKNIFIGLISAIILITLAVGARAIEFVAVSAIGETWTYAIIATLIAVVCIEISFVVTKTIRRGRRYMR